MNYFIKYYGVVNNTNSNTFYLPLIHCLSGLYNVDICSLNLCINAEIYLNEQYAGRFYKGKLFPITTIHSFDDCKSIPIYFISKKPLPLNIKIMLEFNCNASKVTCIKTHCYLSQKPLFRYNGLIKPLFATDSICILPLYNPESYYATIYLKKLNIIF